MNISSETFNKAKEVAATWQEQSDKNRKKAEQKFHDMMIRMLKDPLNKIFLIELLDQSFRAKNPARVADQIEFLFKKYPNANLFSQLEEVLIWLFHRAGVFIPSISVPLFIEYLRSDISNVVLKGENSPLVRHIKMRKREGTRVNINIIGEIVLGEKEAQTRIDKYINALKNPDIDYISIKISTIFSQIVPVAHEWSVDEISKRLIPIYKAAMQNTFVDKEGTTKHKFVNLDMEEYRDTYLTIDALIKTLDMSEFQKLHAGIVLQAYLPDTQAHLRRLTQWAKERVKKGGAPIKVRLVKGANQEMELTESSLRHWPLTTFDEKSQSDANFKLLLDEMLEPENAPYVHVGVASHNLFDQALGMLLAKERGVSEYYTAEMLEGMSETAYEILKNEGLEVILYAPTATKATFTNAIAYLVRRFDENTAEENYLRHSFGLSVGSGAWDTLVKSYDDALAKMSSIKPVPNRTQDRNFEVFNSDPFVEDYIFANEPDTDFALPQNIKWAQSIIDKWKHIGKNGGYHALPVVNGEVIQEGERVEIIDKSQYHEKVVVGSYIKASKEHIDAAIACAKADKDNWRQKDIKQRQRILMQVAANFQKNRADFIGVAAAEVGKVFSETDVEVSEAIDFLNFYPYSARKIDDLEGMSTSPKGVGLVVSPWNFPIAIPVGGIAASLAAGNTVILKPASNAILSGYRLCEAFWEAGVSKNTLQFLPASGALVGEHLVPSEAIDYIIFTGGEQTAYSMLKTRPSVHISAETGGKDATVVTALADKDQAVKNVIGSAFNNSGQKCSATSLLVLEKELYEDENFKQTLIDAVESLQVGSVWDLENKIGSLADKPSGHLKKSLDYLDEGEEWVIKPSYANNDNPYMLKPSIRWGTKQGDYCHMNELFGPVLSVMCANNLEHAIDIVNSTGYGLTSGIESLDEREIALWRQKLKAGNLYINRMTTGAIVIRQPFGGMGKSAIGSGKKAGGFNYVSQFMNLDVAANTELPKVEHEIIKRFSVLAKTHDSHAQSVVRALELAGNFAYWLEKEFAQEHDYANIRGESNIIRYLPVESTLLCLEEGDKLEEIIASIAAIKLSGSVLAISLPEHPKSEALKFIDENQDVFCDKQDSVCKQSTQALIESLRNVQRVRFLQEEAVHHSIYEAAAKDAKYIASTPFVPHGRIEMMHYFIEQSISNSYHRYGNLGLKGLQDSQQS